MADVDRYRVLAERTKEEFPRFRVKMRRKSWLRPIFWLLSKVTRRSYSTFTTTIFSTMYAADDWDMRTSDRKYRTLRHEKMHIQQFHCWPLGRWAWPVNHLLTAIAYISILPVLLTLRARFEREGYTQTLLAEFELHGPFSDAIMELRARWLTRTFGGSTYVWMWRRRAAYAWAMETMRKINAGEITNDRDRVDESQAA